MPPLSRMTFATTRRRLDRARQRDSLPGDPFAISSFAISVCSGFFFCAGPIASSSGVKP
jgi:hypothetical protein